MKYFLEEIKQNELMCRKHKKVCTTVNYIEHFLILEFDVSLLPKEHHQNY